MLIGAVAKAFWVVSRLDLWLLGCSVWLLVYLGSS